MNNVMREDLKETIENYQESCEKAVDEGAKRSLECLPFRRADSAQKGPVSRKRFLNFEKGAARGLLPDTIERNEQKEKAHSKRGTN